MTYLINKTMLTLCDKKMFLYLLCTQRTNYITDKGFVLSVWYLQKTNLKNNTKLGNIYFFGRNVATEKQSIQ